LGGGGGGCLTLRMACAYLLLRVRPPRLNDAAATPPEVAGSLSSIRLTGLCTAVFQYTESYPILVGAAWEVAAGAASRKDGICMPPGKVGQAFSHCTGGGGCCCKGSSSCQARCAAAPACPACESWRPHAPSGTWPLLPGALHWTGMRRCPGALPTPACTGADFEPWHLDNVCVPLTCGENTPLPMK